ncbi:MAG: hypothetical protein QW495_05220 [Candidatus Hadarchaeum sp.]
MSCCAILQHRMVVAITTVTLWVQHLQISWAMEKFTALLQQSPS